MAPGRSGILCSLEEIQLQTRSENAHKTPHNLEGDKEAGRFHCHPRYHIITSEHYDDEIIDDTVTEQNYKQFRTHSVLSDCFLIGLVDRQKANYGLKH